MKEYTGIEARLVIPILGGFYAFASAIGFLLLRVVTGYILFMHGWSKLAGPGLAGVSAYMTKNGLLPGSTFAAAAIFLETAGAACIVLGLFTRFFAAALAVELGIAFLAVHYAHGFAANKGGYEYVLLLGTTMFFIALRGGGPYSFDRMIGKEL